MVGFAIRLNPLLVVVAAAFVTGWFAHLTPVEVLAAFGKAFNDNRLVSLTLLVYPMVGVLERAGLQERARTLITGFKRLSLAPLLIGQDADGRPVTLESYRLADDEKSFWKAAAHPAALAATQGDRFLDYLRRVAQDGDRYNGFNLLVGDFTRRELGWYGNRADAAPSLLEPGVHGLSNSLLNTPWPKLVAQRDALCDLIHLDEQPSLDLLIETLRDPSIDVPFKNIQRNRARSQHDVMKRALVEFGPQLFRRALAQLFDLELADLVGRGLAGPGDVAVDLVHDVEIGFRGVVLEELDRLLARPSLFVHAGVDDEADGAPHLVGELAEFVVRILIEAHLISETFRIQAPALDERRRLEIAPEFRQFAKLERERSLQVVTRHGLVQHQRFLVVLHLLLRLVRPQVEPSRRAAVGRGSLGVGSGRLLPILRDRPDSIQQKRNVLELARQFRLDRL